MTWDSDTFPFNEFDRLWRDCEKLHLKRYFPPSTSLSPLDAKTLLTWAESQLPQSQELITANLTAGADVEGY